MNDYKLSANNPEEASVSLDSSELEPGIYTVSWLALSTYDGHITKGSYIFTDSTTDSTPITDSTIALTNKNYTSFMGNANITTGNEIKYRDVPLIIYLNNGNALNINPDPINTEHHFKGLPIFGTVFSITDESGRQLRGEDKSRSAG